MAKLLYLVVLVTALELCSTHPAKNNAQSKKTNSACMVGGGKFLCMISTVWITS